jgi:hypothetical protein
VSAAMVSCTPTDWVGDGLQPASCDDGRENGDETDVDCGGPSCKQCVIGDTCRASSDCASGECTGGTCREHHCSNLILDQDEEAVDCGGKDCRPCSGDDTCTNKKQDDNETDVDCGGPSNCDRCHNGDSCESDGDCISNHCHDKVCEVEASGAGGTSNTGGTGGAGGLDEGGAAGTEAAPEAGAPDVGTGGASGGSGPSGGTSNSSAGTGSTAAGAGGHDTTGGQGPSSGGTGLDEGGAAGTDSAGGSDQSGGTSSTGGRSGGTGGTGGNATGGNATGGNATGGNATGGNATGGTGGNATGGTGGNATGGNATGGTDPCEPGPPPSDGLITDFSEISGNTTWTSGEQAWGNADFSGTTQTYGSSGTQLTATITSGHALQLSSGFPNENYVGLGLLFDACADASTFAGLSFTVSGNLGGATLYVQLRTVGNLPNDQACGACAYASEQTKWDDCVFNTKNVTSVSGSPQTIKVPWTEFTGGKPNPTSSSTSELLGVQIQFECGQSSGCGPNVTFDDFAFYE